MEQIEEALDGGGFAGAVATEETVALAGFDAQAEVVDGLRAAVLADEVADFNGGRFRDLCASTHGLRSSLDLFLPGTKSSRRSR